MRFIFLGENIQKKTFNSPGNFSKLEKYPPKQEEINRDWVGCFPSTQYLNIEPEMHRTQPMAKYSAYLDIFPNRKKNRNTGIIN